MNEKQKCLACGLFGTKECPRLETLINQFKGNGVPYNILEDKDTLQKLGEQDICEPYNMFLNWR